MLTLKQLHEGRMLYGRACNDEAFDEKLWQHWFDEHAVELLDAAERVARQEAYANEPDGYDSPLSQPPVTHG